MARSATSSASALALTGSSDIIFDWDVSDDRIYVSPEIEDQLGLQARRAGRARPRLGSTCCIRLIATAIGPGSTRVLEQRARAHQPGLPPARRRRPIFLVPPAGAPGGRTRRRSRAARRHTGRRHRTKTALERLLHDAVHDNLTGLPNREMFLDRLELALMQADAGPTSARPCWRWTSTVSSRSTRRSALGRRFGPAHRGAPARPSAASRATRWRAYRRRPVRRHRGCPSRDRADRRISPIASGARVSTPISFGDREIALTVSIGVALFDPRWHPKGGEMLEGRGDRDAPTPRRDGGDRVEVFAPRMRAQRSDRQSLEGDLRRALDRDEIKRAVPADRAAGGSHRRRLRGAAALAPSAARARSSRPISCRSPRRPALMVDIGALRDRARRRANSPPGRRRSRSIRRSSPASTFPRARCCATICSATCKTALDRAPACCAAR